MNQHRRDSLGRGENVERSRCCYRDRSNRPRLSGPGPMRVADGTVEQRLALTADVQLDGRVNSAAVEPANGSPDPADSIGVGSDFDGVAFTPTDRGNRIDVARNLGARDDLRNTAAFDKRGSHTWGIGAALTCKYTPYFQGSQFDHDLPRPNGRSAASGRGGAKNFPANRRPPPRDPLTRGDAPSGGEVRRRRRDPPRRQYKTRPESYAAHDARPRPPAARIMMRELKRWAAREEQKGRAMPRARELETRGSPADHSVVGGVGTILSLPLLWPSRHSRSTWPERLERSM